MNFQLLELPLSTWEDISLSRLFPPRIPSPLIMLFGMCGESTDVQARSEPGSGPYYCNSIITVLRGVISSLHQEPGFRDTERDRQQRCCFISSLFWAWELTVLLFPPFSLISGFFVFRVWPSAVWETCWPSCNSHSALWGLCSLGAWNRLASSFGMWQRAITLTQRASAWSQHAPHSKTLSSDLHISQEAKMGIIEEKIE